MSNSGGGGSEDRGGGGRATSIPTPKMEIPKESKSMDTPHHWWSDLGMFGSRSAGGSSSGSGPPMSPTENVRNRYYSASSSEGTSYGSPPLISHEFPQPLPSGSPPDPKVAIPLPAPGEEAEFREFFRRSSLKNMYCLDDFATPP